MPFKVGTYSGVVTAVVSEHVTEVMLGIGWLMQNEVMWEFSKSRMRIDGVYYPLYRRSNVGVWCRRVISQNRVVIPERSEVDVPTKVIIRKIPAVSEDSEVGWSTEANSVTPGIHVARTLVPTDRLIDIPVRVLNVHNAEFTLEAGTCLADLHPVSVVRSLRVEKRDNILKKSSTESQDIPEFVRKLVDGAHDSLPPDILAGC